MTNYKNAQCWKCDLDLVVEAHDYAERNYCTNCAWDKILARNPSMEVVND
jgi:hypothetical protein